MQLSWYECDSRSNRKLSAYTEPALDPVSASQYNIRFKLHYARDLSIYTMISIYY